MKVWRDFKKNEQGFTFIEIVVGLIILAIGLLAIASMQITSIKGSAFSSHLTQASILAQDQLEYLKNLSFDHPDLNSGKHNEGQVSDTIFSREYEVVEDTGNMLKTIIVTIQWNDHGKHSISFSTIRTK